MKFAIAVVLLAVAFGAEASAVWGAWGPGAYAPAWGASGTFDGRSWNSQWDDGHDSWTGVHGAGAWNDGQWNEGAWGDHGALSARASWAAPAAVAAYGAAVVPAASWAGVPAAVAAYGAAVVPAASWVGVPAAVNIAAPAVVAAHVPAAVTTHAAVIPAAPAWGHEGSYVAKTRGAVHVAPLSGHAKSAAAINVHPAPGTV